MDGTSAAIDYQLDQLLEPNVRHFRFQTELKGVSDSLDDASAANIAGLRKLAEKLIEESAANIAAYSIPITPAPATTIERGTCSSWMIPSESMMVRSSNATLAGRAGLVPVAMTVHCEKFRFLL